MERNAFSSWEVCMKPVSLCFGSAESSRLPPSFRPYLEALETRNRLSVCTVDRLTDNNTTGGGEGGNGMGDLRWCAIESLFQADSINFSVTGTINLAAVLPTLTRSVSIDGPGADLMTVRRDTGGGYRIFSVPSGVTADISGLTIANGNTTDSGGAGVLNAGILTISNSIISGNTASLGGTGGGISNSGTLTVTNSTVSKNSAGIGGGIANGGTLTISDSTIAGNVADISLAGGIINNGTTTVTNSSITGNSASVGAGIYNLSTSGSLTVTNSTLAGNTAASQGGGVFNNLGALAVSNSTIAANSAGFSGGGIYFSSAMAARNTIIATNTAPGGPDVYGKLGSQGYNLIGNPQDMTGWVDTDLLHVDPLLGPLQDNGGPTLTMALLDGSPAIDAGDNTGAPDWDQRGEGFPRIVNDIIDIGAFEVQPAPVTLFYGDTAPLAAVSFTADNTLVVRSAETSQTAAPIAARTWVLTWSMGHEPCDGRPVGSETPTARAPLLVASHVMDAVFPGCGDAEVDVLASSLR
jgi:hypothetical protein